MNNSTRPAQADTINAQINRMHPIMMRATRCDKDALADRLEARIEELIAYRNLITELCTDMRGCFSSIEGRWIA
jgi:hypothetical protein